MLLAYYNVFKVLTLSKTILFSFETWRKNKMAFEWIRKYTLFY